MVTILHAISSGLRRALLSLGLVLVLWLVNLLFALPLGVLMADHLQSAIGSSRVHETLRTGFDLDWYGEYAAGAKGVAATFRPSILGAAAFYDNLEDWLTGDLFRGPGALVALGVGYALLWAFLLGGALEHFARFERFGVAGFTAAGGQYFFRFLRLLVISGGLYYLIYRLFRFLLLTIEDRTRDVVVEKTVLFWVLLAASACAFLLVLVRVVFDYAKILVVVESRRSVLGALRDAVRFVLSRPVATFGIYLGLALAGLLLLAAYAAVAPGAGQSTVAAIVFAFLVGQAYLIAKMYLRLSLLAAQMALYQSTFGRTSRPAMGGALAVGAAR